MERQKLHFLQSNEHKSINQNHIELSQLKVIMIDGTTKLWKFIQSRERAKEKKTLVKVTPISRLDCPQFIYLFNYMSPIRFHSLSDNLITNGPNTRHKKRKIKNGTRFEWIMRLFWRNKMG